MSGKLNKLAQEMNPTFNIVIPSLNKKVLFRSFLVKEQKLLLIAKEAKENKNEAAFNAVMQLINNCIQTDNIDVYSLPAFDIQYIFIQLYISSVAKPESIVHYKCLKKDEEGNVCDTVNKVKIDLRKASVSPNAIKDGVIDINSESIDKIILRYPTLAESVEFDEAVLDNDTARAFKVYGGCLQYVYQKNGAVLQLGDDYDVEDAVEFLEYFPGSVFEKVTGFFKTMPVVQGCADYSCAKCGNKTELKLSGLEDFF